jgi:hypothetical protein
MRSPKAPPSLTGVSPGRANASCSTQGGNASRGNASGAQLRAELINSDTGRVRIFEDYNLAIFHAMQLARACVSGASVSAGRLGRGCARGIEKRI